MLKRPGSRLISTFSPPTAGREIFDGHLNCQVSPRWAAQVRKKKLHSGEKRKFLIHFFFGPSQKKSTKFCKNIYLDSETPAIVAISRSQKVTGTFWNRPVGRSLLFSLPPFIRILLQPVAFQDRRAASYTLRLEIYWIFILFWNTGPQQETGAFRTPCRFQGGNFTLDSANNWSLRFVNGHKRYAGQIRRVNIELFRLLSL